jgi:hypothetical protein
LEGINVLRLVQAVFENRVNLVTGPAQHVSILWANSLVSLLYVGLVSAPAATGGGWSTQHDCIALHRRSKKIVHLSLLLRGECEKVLPTSLMLSIVENMPLGLLCENSQVEDLGN